MRAPDVRAKPKKFLSTLSLRRATGQHAANRHRLKISIHALLAESDERKQEGPRRSKNFYPRSPCGERPAYTWTATRWKTFLSTLSLRRATLDALTAQRIEAFLSTLSLRRATCVCVDDLTPEQVFLSTLSLRRATTIVFEFLHIQLNFYPRSPCGERRQNAIDNLNAVSISIHALLAESDPKISSYCYSLQIFLSTLSLRRATRDVQILHFTRQFLSTLSLRRATYQSIYR